MRTSPGHVGPPDLLLFVVFVPLLIVLYMVRCAAPGHHVPPCEVFLGHMWAVPGHIAQPSLLFFVSVCSFVVLCGVWCAAPRHDVPLSEVILGHV